MFIIHRFFLWQGLFLSFLATRPCTSKVLDEHARHDHHEPLNDIHRVTHNPRYLKASARHLAIPNRYIVLYHDKTAFQAVLSGLLSDCRDCRHIQTFSSIQTAVLSLTDNALQHLLEQDCIDSIEEDEYLELGGPKIQAASNQTGSTATVTTSTRGTTQSWGLDRIDQTNVPLSGTYTVPDMPEPASVLVYVLDSGIRVTHTQFGGRAGYFKNYVADLEPFDTDAQGHGTHVAGIVGSADYGVAPALLNIVSSKVCLADESCVTSAILAALEDCGYRATGFREKGRNVICNLSLSGSFRDSLQRAVTVATNHGALVVVAAGNSNQDACNFSPAAHPRAITVGATDSADQKYLSSNYGKCVDIFAPGARIVSLSYTSDTALDMLSGTSMAAAQISGAAALVWSQYPNLTADEVKNRIISNCASNRLSNIGVGSPNCLLNIEFLLDTFGVADVETTCTTVSHPCRHSRDCCSNKCTGLPGSRTCKRSKRFPVWTGTSGSCNTEGVTCSSDTDCCSQSCRLRDGAFRCTVSLACDHWPMNC